ncbi:MAG TPA: zf-HC2 domain-containing protein [Streptosporangiaceae bacterium]|nr:zf-HC2 domain-containing protein [Streptosporangiaceae bacterium]
MVLARLRSHRDLVCRQAVGLVTDYLDGALSRTSRRRFERHLAHCPHCAEHFAQVRRTIELTGSIEPEDLTEQMQNDFVELYRRWRDSEG